MYGFPYKKNRKVLSRRPQTLFHATDYADCAAWWRADDADPGPGQDPHIATWADRISGRSLTALSPALTPIFISNSWDNLPAVTFNMSCMDGAYQWLSTDQRTMIMTLQLDDISNASRYVMGVGQGGGNSAYWLGYASNYLIIHYYATSYNLAGVGFAGDKPNTIIYTYDPAGPSNKVYVNGILVHSNTDTLATTNNFMRIGDWCLGGYPAMAASVYEFVLYNHCFSAAEVVDADSAIQRQYRTGR